MIDYTELGKTAAGAVRCAVLVRHGERPPIDPADETFGENLPITEEGERLAARCGAALAASDPDPAAWSFASSRLLRTRLTAAAVAKAMGRAEAPIAVCPEVSLPGFWVGDMAETHRHYFAEGSVPFTTRLLDDGVAEGYRPIAESTRMALEWLATDPAGARRSLICTHDVFIACLLRSFGEKRVSCERWVGFLQGIALFQDATGAWRHEWLVPDKSDWERPFYQ